jgi:fucose 4-O-acetylase-like acetyltransferase
MAVFFFLAGYVSLRIIRRGRAAFLASKVRGVLYPYIVWSLIFGSLEVLLSGYTNTPLNWRALLLIGWEPIGHFWFLYALFAVQLCGVILWSSRVALLSAAVLSIAVEAPYPISPIASFLPIYLAGVAAAGVRANASRGRSFYFGALVLLAIGFSDYSSQKTL